MSKLPKISISVEDRLILHLFEEHDQKNKFLVSNSVTRPGIAEACALHAPNVSRSMRSLVSKSIVEEHMRSVKGDSRKQKTWQLTDEGEILAKIIFKKLGNLKVLIRDKKGDLLEIIASDASQKLESELSLLQILMHALHEGVLTYGDIRFGPILRKEKKENNTSILMSGVTSTYLTQAPNIRELHGRINEAKKLDEWYNSSSNCMVVTGIAGIGKSTLCAEWLNHKKHNCIWYPCQPWDTELGVAISLLHALGIRENKDDMKLIETLPLSPGQTLEIDMLTRRLIDFLNSEKRDMLFVLDDVHHLPKSAMKLIGALLQISQKTNLRLLLISRRELNFYDRRDVHTRKLVNELSLIGLTIEELDEWLNKFSKKTVSAKEIHSATGGHPLAIEFLELYGQKVHGDWLRFLDEEILDILPKSEYELLATLANSERPIPWNKLASVSEFEGKPPEQLIKHGLLIELNEGFWLHEALRERLLRDVSKKHQYQKNKFDIEN
ncbi:MAG: hypothetical protein CMB64_03080 [Euryarchaeota archaeon]|nr:hypothetical protein [Euryarchaeota archaeon]